MKKTQLIKEQYGKIRAVLVQKTQKIKNGIDKKKNPPPSPLPPSPPPPIQDANPETAKTILRRVANGALWYSVRHGGNGKKNFPTSALDIIEFIPIAVKDAIVFNPETADKAEPIDGYLLRMSDKSAADDFVFEAYPAKYFVGPVFEIDKNLRITEMKK